MGLLLIVIMRVKAFIGSTGHAAVGLPKGRRESRLEPGVPFPEGGGLKK